MKPERPNITLIGYGNRARGDDAVGPLLLDRLSELPLPDRYRVTTIEALQLNPEHAYDLIDCAAVVFIDAQRGRSVTFTPLTPNEHYPFSSHSQTPEAVLALYQQLCQQPPPPCYLLAIGGERFALGELPSERALEHLQQAEQLLLTRLEQPLAEWSDDAMEASGDA